VILEIQRLVLDLIILMYMKMISEKQKQLVEPGLNIEDRKINKEWIN
jgi:hypothetical protein